MAYTRKNLLLRVKEVNETFVAKQKIGLSTEYIYRHFIWPVYHISRSTLYEYLAIPYKTQLKEIERRETEEKRIYPSLFKDEDFK